MKGQKLGRSIICGSIAHELKTSRVFRSAHLVQSLLADIDSFLGYSWVEMVNVGGEVSAALLSDTPCKDFKDFLKIKTNNTGF